MQLNSINPSQQSFGAINNIGKTVNKAARVVKFDDLVSSDALIKRNINIPSYFILEGKKIFSMGEALEAVTGKKILDVKV